MSKYLVADDGRENEVREIPTNNGDAMNVRLVDGPTGQGPDVIQNTNAIGATGALYYESAPFTPTKSNISLTAKIQFNATTEGPQTFSLYLDDNIPANLIDQAIHTGIGANRVNLQGVTPVDIGNEYVFVLTATTDTGDILILANGGFQVIKSEF